MIERQHARDAGVETRIGPYADERILYRTRDDILTDRRLITGGATYPLATLSAVRVVPTRLYVPVQAGRAIGLFLGTVLLVFVLAGGLGEVALPLHPALYFLAALPCVLFALTAGWLLPIFALQLQTGRGRLLVMRSGDFETLRAFALRIHALIQQRHEGQVGRG